ncbi:MAG: gerAA 1 [Firmicutes bacterium]|nr:gerAA 1 [Bacillota bacterium]
MNIFSKNFKALKELVLFHPPKVSQPFILQENEPSTNIHSNELGVNQEQLQALLRYARRLTKLLQTAEQFLQSPLHLDKLQDFKMEYNALEKQQSDLSPIIDTYSSRQSRLDQTISTSLEENIILLKRLYNWPQNKDLVLRNINFPAAAPFTAKLAFIEGLVDRKKINLGILQPLMSLYKINPLFSAKDFLGQLINQYLPSEQTVLVHTIGEIVSGINLGDTIILFDGLDKALLIETKGQEHRSIDRPTMEQSVRGSQSGFTETLRVNTGLIRSILRTNDLTTELFTIGTRSNTLCALMYLKSVINPALTTECRRRLNSLNIDAISDSGTLEKFLEDKSLITFPQMLSTERPDRVAAALTEGRLAIILDGSPFALVAPITFFTLFHAAEDFSYSWLAGSFSRLIRLLGAIITTMLPAFYLAISYFHQEALPTELILAIGGARERVPFPAVVEIAAMELAFELLREGGIRVPGMLGSTIGIVGAIILGQAAVAANIVSPITVVIISVTGLASFIIPDYSLSFTLRLVRFAFEILAALLGLVGMASGLFLITVFLCSMKSLGVPYMAPVGPKTGHGYDVVVRGPVYSQERRPDELSPQDIKKQASISRLWTKETPVKKDDDS